MLNVPVQKLLALLGYLAVEGAGSRSQLAGLLWTELDESSARRNLRQRLYRIAPAILAEFVIADASSVWLTPHTSSDVTAFGAALASEDYGAAVALYAGPLLEGLELTEASGFHEWLDAKRDALERAHCQALAGWAGQLEGRGQTREALHQHLRLIDSNPLLEAHQRQVMRLRAVLGERTEALAGFERFKALLSSDLGLEAMPETLQLAADIRGSVTIAQRVRQPKTVPALPALNAPMIGREDALRQLETAWGAGQIVFVSGEPGVGKSRLLAEFAASKTVLYAQGRAGDAGMPFSTQVRVLRRLLEANPSVRLPRWVRQELSRIMPELDGDPPSGGPEARLRLFDACAEFTALMTETTATYIIDDLQFLDAESFEIGLHVQARLTERGQTKRQIIAYRSGELTPAMSAVLEGAVRGGRALEIHLEGLDEEAVRVLVQRLFGAERPVLFAQRLHRATGGNPFFALETLKSLVESSALEQNDLGEWSTPFDDTTHEYGELPMPGSVLAAVRGRVMRLGAGAMRLLETASLAGDAFTLTDLQTATTLTELEALESLERSLELRLLERQGAGYRFAHDLVREALALGLGTERQRLLHRKLAESLERRSAPAARIAAHLEQAGLKAAAAPWRIRAAEDASRVYAHREALHQLGLALEDGAPAFELQLRRESLLATLGDSEGRMATIERLQVLAGDDAALNVQVALVRVTFLNQRFAFAEAFAVASQVLERSDLTRAQLGGALIGGGEALVRMDRVLEAEHWYERAIALGDALPRSLMAQAHSGIRVCAVFRGDYALALHYINASLADARAAGDRAGEAHAIIGVGRIQTMTGEYAASAAALEAGLTLARTVGATLEQLYALHAITALHSLRGQFQQCFESHALAYELNARIGNVGIATSLEIYRARALRDAGRLGESATMITAAVAGAAVIASLELLTIACRDEAHLHLVLGDTARAAAQLTDSLRGIAGENLRSMHFGLPTELAHFAHPRGDEVQHSHMAILDSELAHCALRRGDLDLTRDSLERAERDQHLTYASDQRDLALIRAALHLSCGEIQPVLDATAPTDEVLTYRTRALTLRLEALRLANQSPLETVTAALSWLESSETPALEGLDLRRAVAVTLRGLGRDGDARLAQEGAERTLDALLASLESHPALQRCLREQYRPRAAVS